MPPEPEFKRAYLSYAALGPRLLGATFVNTTDNLVDGNVRADIHIDVMPPFANH